MNSIMDSVCKYLAECPVIDSSLPFHLDYVDDNDCYCVGTQPNPTYRKDVLGNRIYTVTFQFAYRTAISSDAERGKNMEFLEQFCRWVDEQNDRRSFPALAANQTAQSLKVIETSALDEVDEVRTTGIYITQLQFIYKERIR